MLKDPGLENFYSNSKKKYEKSGLVCVCDCNKPKFPNVSSYPILQISQHQLENTKMLQNRYSIFDVLNKKNKKSNIMEIGVMGGDFALEACKKVNIDNLFLIDPFTNNDDMATKENKRFDSNTNYEYIKYKFKDYEFVKTYQGMSYDILPKYFSNILDEDKMDFIYIDTNHEFTNTYNEIVYASKIVKDDGIIGIDDYTFAFYNPIDKCEVMQAVNYFLNQNKDWHVSYYSTHEHGLHNIYISKTI